MKRIVIAILAVLISVSTYAGTYLHSSYYRTYENNEWSEGEEINSDIWLEGDQLDINHELIFKFVGEPTFNKHDDLGGESASCNAIDPFGNHCGISLRISPNGERQLYIRYNNVTFGFAIDKWKSY